MNQALLFAVDPPEDPRPEPAAPPPASSRRRMPRTDLPADERPETGIEWEQLAEAWVTHLEPQLEHSCDSARRRFAKWLAREQKRWT